MGTDRGGPTGGQRSVPKEGGDPALPFVRPTQSHPRPRPCSKGQRQRGHPGLTRVKADCREGATRLHTGLWVACAGPLARRLNSRATGRDTRPGRHPPGLQLHPEGSPRHGGGGPSPCTHLQQGHQLVPGAPGSGDPRGRGAPPASHRTLSPKPGLSNKVAPASRSLWKESSVIKGCESSIVSAVNPFH